MLEWLSNLNWWGAFGALSSIGVVIAFSHHASKKTAKKQHSKQIQ